MANERYLYEDTARDVAGQYGVPPAIFASLISTESGWNPSAHAQGSTASGLTQMIDGTAAAMGADKGNPRSQMEGGAKYLRQQYDRTGNWNTALAAYNQGPGAANNPAGQKYASKVMAGAPSSDPHVDALLSLPDVKGGDSAPAPAHADPAVASLLAMPDVKPAGPPITGDPITGDPNADPRDIQSSPGYQRQKDIVNAQPGWLPALKARSPGFGKAVEAVGAPFMQPTAQKESTARGAVRGALGSLGDLENLGANTVPNFVRKTVGAAPTPDEKTIFPTSETVGKVLDTFGWHENPAWKDYEEGGVMGGGMLIPGSAASEGASNTAKAVKNYAEKGGKGGQQMRGLVDQIGGEATAATGERVTNAERIVGETPMPNVRAPKPVTPIKPEPVGDFGPSPTPVPQRERLADNLGSSKGAPTALADLSTDFESAVTAHSDSLRTQKQAVWNEFQTSLGDQKMVDLTGLKAQLGKKLEDAGTSAARDSYASLLNDISHVEANSQTPIEAIQEIRKQLAGKAKFGQETTGYAAVSANDAKDFSKQIGSALREGHDAYGPFADKYRELSLASEPAGAKFLKSVGETEGGANLMGSAMKSPKNVETAIAAMGGDTKKFDELATKYIANQIANKSGTALEKFVKETSPMTRNLPEARAAMESFVQRTQLTEAREAIAKKVEEGLTARSKAIMESQKAADKATETLGKQSTATALARQRGEEAAAMTAKQAHETALATAADYRADLTVLQSKPPEGQGPALTSIIERMRKDGLIDEPKFNAFVGQIKDANNAVGKEKAFRSLAKYITYALTGNYLVSFGGPAAFRYLTHK